MDIGSSYLFTNKYIRCNIGIARCCSVPLRLVNTEQTDDGELVAKRHLENKVFIVGYCVFSHLVTEIFTRVAHFK